MTSLPPSEAFAAALSIALKILSTRVLSFLALGMTFGLFSWSMWAHSWISFTSAGTFAVLVYLPALWSSRGTP